MDIDYEAAAVAHARYLGDTLPPRPDIYQEVKVIIDAALGDEPWNGSPEPDTRLQAIKDAYAHFVEVQGTARTSSWGAFEKVLDLLDALTEEGSDNE